MRFSVFVALLVAAFLACCSSFANAENIRRLHAKVPAVVVNNNKDNVAKLAGGFLEKLKTNAALSKTVKAVQASDGDEAAVRNAITAFAATKDSAKMSDEGIAKISAMMANTAQKNPKSWPRLRKFAMISLGASVASLVVYGAYKALFDRNSSSSASTSESG